MNSKELVQLKSRRLELLKKKIELRGTSSLLAFTLATKPDYHVSWHHKAICNTLDRFVEGDVRRLMVFVPPRNGKSELVSRRLPAYILGRDPEHSLIATSYSSDLASRLNRDVQRIIDEPTYNRIFPETTLSGMNYRTDTKGTYSRNNDIFEVVNHRGVYRSAGVGGGITGMGAQTVIIDDPIKNREEADSARQRSTLKEWYTSTLRTRLEKDGKIILMMTRWHQDDLAGWLLDLARKNDKADQWEVISFPAVKEEATMPGDPREEGEPLWPQKYSSEELEKIKHSSGSRTWNALYQQRPTAQEGGIVKRDWISHWSVLPMEFEEMISSWDLTFKDTSGSDFVVGQVWGRVGSQFYLVDSVRDRMDFPTTVKAVKRMALQYPKCLTHLIEDQANGAAVISTLKKSVAGIIPYNPKTSKDARLSAVSPLFEAGNVFIPPEDLFPWVSSYLEEIVNFPNWKNDDQVDATSQALLRFTHGSAGRFSKEFEEKDDDDFEFEQDERLW